jgi:hypothetical protein
VQQGRAVKFMSTRPEVPADAYSSALVHQQFPIATHGLSSLVVKPQALVCSAELSNAGQTCVSLVVQNELHREEIRPLLGENAMRCSIHHLGGLLHSVAQHMAMTDGCEQAHSAIESPARGEAHRRVESVAEGLRQQTYLGSG